MLLILICPYVEVDAISAIALVTGANGFLGRYIVEQLLERGSRVRAFCRSRDDHLEQLGAELHLGDIRDREAVCAACGGIDVVYHAAGVAGIWGPWDRFHSINTAGTAHVIDGCRQRAVPKLVYTSSPSVTFDGRPQEGIDESAPYSSRWLCHYPHTKALAEQAVLAANDDQLATCSLRPHLIWGPRDRHLVPRLLQRARAGQLKRVGDGTNLVDMIYVENAAAAHLRAADVLGPRTAVAGRAYFISQGEPVNCWAWINQILNFSGIPAVQKAISMGAAWRIGHALECVHRLFGIEREPRMTRFLAAQLGGSHYFDIERARNDFGYSPQVSTNEGMVRLGNWLADGKK